jgi:hypothetical protein
MSGRVVITLRQFTRGVCYGAALLTVVTLGRWLGFAYGKNQVGRYAGSGRVGLESYLAKNILGIAVGRIFPSIPVWSADGARAVDILELLPRGGVIILVTPECYTCIQVIEAVHAATHSGGVPARPVVIVASTSNKLRDLAAFISGHAIDIPLYCDTEEALIRQFSVIVNPAYFRVDSAGVVLEFGPAGLNSGEYANIVSGP